MFYNLGRNYPLKPNDAVNPNARIEGGINARDFRKTPRLIEQPRGNMCNYIVHLNDVKEVDAELIAWLKLAYEGAG